MTGPLYLIFGRARKIALAFFMVFLTTFLTFLLGFLMGFLTTLLMVLRGAGLGFTILLGALRGAGLGYLLTRVVLRLVVFLVLVFLTPLLPLLKEKSLV